MIATALDDVAQIYRTTAAMGYPALDEVEARLGCSRTTAARRVREAHRAGLIPHIQRRPHRKIVAVADALDVTPAELATAVSEFADGALTITNHSPTGGSP